MRALGIGSLMALASSFDRGALLSDLPSGGPVSSVKFSAPVPKSRVKLRSLIRVCRGGAHGIFWSDVGEVRKPFDAETITWDLERDA